jgi:hypothetical protein
MLFKNSVAECSAMTQKPDDDTNGLVFIVLFAVLIIVAGMATCSEPNPSRLHHDTFDGKSGRLLLAALR